MHLETTMLSLQYSVILAAEEALPRASGQECSLALPHLWWMPRAPLETRPKVILKLKTQKVSRRITARPQPLSTPKLSPKKMSRQPRRRSSTTRSTPSTTWRTPREMTRTTVALSTQRKPPSLSLILYIVWAAESRMWRAQPRQYWLAHWQSNLMRKERHARSCRRS
jgi:hypothetical protein